MAEEDAGAEGVVKLPSKNLLMSLHRQSLATAKRASEVSGELGTAIREAKDKKGLHPQAFKLASKLLNQSPEKIGQFLAHFDDYREKMDLDKAAGIDAFEGETVNPRTKREKRAKAAKEELSAAASDDGNVTPLRGRGEAAGQATA